MSDQSNDTQKQHYKTQVEKDLDFLANKARRGTKPEMSIPINLNNIYDELHLLNDLIMYSISHDSRIKM